MSEPEITVRHIPVIFYGEAAELARQLGVPIFIDGDTGELITPQCTCPHCGCDPQEHGGY